MKLKEGLAWNLMGNRGLNSILGCSKNLFVIFYFFFFPHGILGEMAFLAF